MAAEFLDARDAYEAQRSKVLSNAVSPAEVDRVLALGHEAKKGQDQSPRAAGFARLKESNPGQADAIDKLQQALLAYEQVKGPLDDPNDLIRMLRGAGVLEFRIAALPADPATDRAGEPINTNSYVTRLEEKGPRAGLTEEWRWFKVQEPDQFVDKPADRQALADHPEEVPAFYASRLNLVARVYGGDVYVLLANSQGKAMTGTDDWKLTSTTRQSDTLGRPAVGFSLDGKGAELMAELTGPNVGRMMAIVLDGQLMSAPRLQSQLSGGGTITGEFSNAEYQYLLQTLGAGSLEGQLSYDPISIKTTGPALGQDNLREGLEACITSLIIVAAFMAVYYFFAGLVADFALLANMVIILGIMSMIEATFTLPGIAGLVLTIGMAVDANVLIFERIREELEAKADLPTAVRLGFGKALSTIIDANLTTLITCVVLGYTATAEVKGFAVVLGIGILATMFTALFSSHVIIDLYVRFFKPRSLSMLPMVSPTVRRILSPNVDWIGLRKLFLPVSGALIVAGLAMVFYRGSDILDIEFRSGTEVSSSSPRASRCPSPRSASAWPISPIPTRPGASTPRYRDTARKVTKEHGDTSKMSGDLAAPQPVDWKLLADAQVVTLGEPTADGKATGFSVATLIENSSAVSDAIRESFRDDLNVTESLDFAGSDCRSHRPRASSSPSPPPTSTATSAEATPSPNPPPPTCNPLSAAWSSSSTRSPRP